MNTLQKLVLIAGFIAISPIQGMHQHQSGPIVKPEHGEIHLIFTMEAVRNLINQYADFLTDELVQRVCALGHTLESLKKYRNQPNFREFLWYLIAQAAKKEQAERMGFYFEGDEREWNEMLNRDNENARASTVTTLSERSRSMASSSSSSSSTSSTSTSPSRSTTSPLSQYSELFAAASQTPFIFTDDAVWSMHQPIRNIAQRPWSVPPTAPQEHRAEAVVTSTTVMAVPNNTTPHNMLRSLPSIAENHVYDEVQDDDVDDEEIYPFFFVQDGAQIRQENEQARAANLQAIREALKPYMGNSCNHGISQ